MITNGVPSPSSPLEGDGRGGAGVLFQYSVSTAFVAGSHSGGMPVGDIRAHGDLGLGTYENFDGEMVALDGRFYQVTSTGSVREVQDSALSPFTTVTRFVAGAVERDVRCRDSAELSRLCDGLRKSGNLFYAFRITGEFDSVHARSMCKAAPGTPLVEAAATQPEFEFSRKAGNLVGFWTPAFAAAINIPGYHLHFLSADRLCGGHLLDFKGARVTVQVQELFALRVALPKTPEFMNADLTRDPRADLARAEGGR